MHRILSATPLWDRRVWNLQVTDLREDKLELRALISAANSGDAWELRCHLREEVVKYVARRHPTALPHTRLQLAPASDGGTAARTGEGPRPVQRLG